MQRPDTADMAFDTDNLYREELYTDQKLGTLRKLIPITRRGEEDTSRAVVFQGQAQMMTPAGVLPLTFDIPASNLEEACAGFSRGAEQAMKETMEELQEMRRQAASSIMVPGQGGGMPPGFGGGPGKIQL